MSPEPPRYVTMPSAPEDDAYFHPAGRLRTLADATLENYRPEPTLLLRAASRRKRYSWVAVALLLPVVVLAAFEISARAGDAPVTTATRATTATKVATATPAPTTAPATPTVAATAATTSKKPPVKADTKAATPVFDVNSLPSAGGARPKPRR